MNKQKPVFSIIIAACLWGLMSIFVRRLGAAGLSVFDISLVRVFFATLFMLAVIIPRSLSLLRVRLRDLWMFVGTGLVSLTLFNVCYFTVISRGDISVAVALLYTSPIWVTLFSAIFFREKITRKKVLAVCLTFTGCVLISGVVGSTPVSAPLFFIGLASGISYSLYSIFARVALKKYDSRTVTLYTFLFSLAGLLFLSDIDKIVAVTVADPPLILCEAGVGIFCAGMPYLLYTWGLKHTEAGNAAVFACAEPVVAAIVGVALFHEAASPVRLAGFALILLSSVLLAVNFRQRSSVSKHSKSII